MNKNSENEQEKLLLHSIKDIVINETEKKENKANSINNDSDDSKYPSAKAVVDFVNNAIPTNVSDLTNDSQFITNADLPTVPTKTSDLTNDSGFLTSHQDITGKENTANKTTTINAQSTNTQYPSALAVKTFVESSVQNTGSGNYVDTYPTLAEQIDEIQNQIIELGGEITLYNIATSEPVACGAQITSVADISNLCIEKDDINWNTQTTEKIPFMSKGSKGPTATIMFRQSILCKSKPSLFFKFFLRNIPSGTSSMTCKITINDTDVQNAFLLVLSGQNHQAEYFYNTNERATPFYKIKIEFDDVALAGMQLDYIEATITNTQNCIILNRDDSFSFVGVYLASSSREKIFYGHYINGQFVYDVQYQNTFNFNQIMNPTNTAPTVDQNNYPINITTSFQHTTQNNGFTTLTSVSSGYALAQISSDNNKLYCKWAFDNQTIINLLETNVFQASATYHNYDIQYYYSLVNYFLLVKNDLSVQLVHSCLPSKKYQIMLNSSYLPNEFVGTCGIIDWFMRGRTTYVQNVGYILIHKSGDILFFPGTLSTYSIKIGKGRQVNAYLSEDALSINVYYNLDNTVYKKVLTRSTLGGVWSLSNTQTTYSNTKDLRECHNTAIYQDLSLIWHEIS